MTAGRLTIGRGPVQVVVDADAGGRIASWTIGDLELLVPSSPARNAEAWGCYPMVPWAGRVLDARFRWEGAEVHLPHPVEQHALHGLGHRRSWSVLDADQHAVRLGLTLPAAFEGWPSGGWPSGGWPFGGSVIQTITATEQGVDLGMAVTAGDREMPLTVGWHPWFVRTLDGVEGQVSLRAGRMLERDAAGLPTHRWRAPTAGPWDDCFTEVSSSPTVSWPGVGVVTVSTDLDHVVVFDQHPDGLCVEPQSGPPDELNRIDRRTLTAGSTFTGGATLRWAAG